MQQTNMRKKWRFMLFTCPYYIWDKVFKSGPTKICGTQPLRNFTWSTLEYFVPSLAAQFAEYGKNRVSVFEARKITSSFVLGLDGIRHPDFNSSEVANNIQYYHNRHTRYTSCRIERKRHSLLKKEAKLVQVTESYPPLHCLASRQTSSSTNLSVCYVENLIECRKSYMYERLKYVMEV